MRHRVPFPGSSLYVPAEGDSNSVLGMGIVKQIYVCVFVLGGGGRGTKQNYGTTYYTYSTSDVGRGGTYSDIKIKDDKTEKCQAFHRGSPHMQVNSLGSRLIPVSSNL